MRKLTFIDYPKFVPCAEYDKAISGMVEKLKNIPGVVSLYQLGSISNSGISDIDMLVIFNDNSSCHIDPRKELTRTERYLFIHNLFGMSLSHFTESQKYSFFHGYNLLHGKDLIKSISDISESDKKILKQQIALEYLIKMYQTLSIQITYGIIKLRSILLEVKALLFDLEFLEVKKGQLFELTNKCIDIRSHWFKNRISKKELQYWILSFHKELDNFLKEKLIIEKKKFYYGIADKYFSSKNVVFLNENNVGFKHTGLILPKCPAKILEKRYYNLNSRFNRFIFHIPVTDHEKIVVLKEKSTFEKKSSQYNHKHFPFFSTLKTSLNMLNDFF